VSGQAGQSSRLKTRESRGRRLGHWSGAAVHAASLLLALLLSLSPVAAPEAHADAFADGARAYSRQDYPLSARIFLPLAEQGDPRAQAYIGVMYLRGQGVPQNFDAAAYWLHLASESGLPTAQYFLGLMYDKGQGVAQDFVLAHAWLNIAVAHAEPKMRRRWVLIRDAIASKMSEAQLAEARRLAYGWRPGPPR
jgi:TPR repeat protein